MADIPLMVAVALTGAHASGFAESCRPEHGRLLQVLARGHAGGRIGETGTGCGVGLAWLGAGAGPDAELVSVEHDAGRAEIARRVFESDDRVSIVEDGWSAIVDRGPFDLLVLDGGGSGKDGGELIDTAASVRVGGTIVIDDFTPFDTWPAEHGGRPDAARTAWLDHPLLVTTEIRLAADLSTLVARRVR